MPTSFDLHNLDPSSHCGQKVGIPQRFFTIMKCVFSYQQFLAPGPPLTISSNVIPMEYFSCSVLYCFVCCVCKDVRLRTFLSLICQFVWSKPRRVSERCWNEYFSFYELWCCCCFLASVFLKTPSFMCVWSPLRFKFICSIHIFGIIGCDSFRLIGV